jgi:predicted Zn-dependent protease
MRAILTAAVALCAAAAPVLAPSAQAQSLLRDAEIEALMREYTDPLLDAAGLAPADTHLYLVNDDGINAFVSGGQNIFINSGTITEAENPNQLKGVIAHEIGHIAGGHLSRSARAQGAAVGAMLATMGIGLLAAVAGATDAGAMVMAGSQQMGYASMAAHTYVQEAAADQAGVTFLERTGQSGMGSLQFFDKLRMREVLRDRETGSFYGDFLRTHPLSADRIESLRRRVEASPYKDVTDSAEEMHAFEMIQAKIIGFQEPPNRVLRRYPADDTSQPARYARAVAHYRNGGLTPALTEIDSLIADEPENPFFHELKGQMLFESGKAEDSITPYREAVRLMPQSGLLHAGLGQSLVAANKPEHQDEAIQELKLAASLDRELPMAWYQLSIAYDRAGERELAELAVAEQSYAMGDYIRAREFARRARDGLDQSAMDWRRATDILAVSESLAREQAENQRRLNNSLN